MYSELPALTAPGFRDFFTLAKTSFTIRSLTNDSDELDVGHRKLVHAWGAEARFRFVSSKSARGYTGIYESGSDCVIGRLSMATKPTKTTTVPALALKFFISGHKSENLQIMNSTSGQKSHNFFEMPFSNIIPPPDSFAKRLMQKLFRKAAVAFGAKDPRTRKRKPAVVCELLDLASFDSIRAFAQRMEKEDRLDYLINNAGTMRDPTRVLTKVNFWCSACY